MNYLSEIISVFSFVISFLAFVLVYLNRNDKFSPQVFAYFEYSSKGVYQSGNIFVENFSGVPAFISSVNLNSNYEIYRDTQKYPFVELSEKSALDDSVLRAQYENLEDSLKGVCENRTLLPGQRIYVTLIDPVFAKKAEYFRSTSIKDQLVEQEKEAKGFLFDVSLTIEYKKSIKKKFIAFPLRVILDKFKQEIIIFESDSNRE